MKIRSGFISNSSSSSFIIAKGFLTKEQIELIKNHKEEGVKLNCKYADSDNWDITEDEFTIMGDTSMDNFDMSEFLEKINVDMSKVKMYGD